MKLTILEKIQFEYYKIKFLITDKTDVRFNELITKKYNLTDIK